MGKVQIPHRHQCCIFSSQHSPHSPPRQIPTNSLNLIKFLAFSYKRNMEYLRGILSFHDNYHILIMRNDKTPEILSSLLCVSHKIFVKNFHTEIHARPLLQLYGPNADIYAWIILCMRPANERRRFIVTSSLIG